MFPRTIQARLFAALDKDKVVIMTGARQVGKTTLLLACRDYLQERGDLVNYLTLDDPLIKANLDEHPERLFQYIPAIQKLQYVLIDEIQYLKDPTQFLKYHYDLNKDRIRLVVTGSSSFYIDTKFRDSLAGRKILLPIYSLSFSEYLIFKGFDMDLAKKALSGSYPAKQEVIRFGYEYAIYGGYPECVLLPNHSDKLNYLQELVQTYTSKDIYEAGVEYRDKYLRLMKLMASQIGNLVNKSELANTLDISAPLVDKYLYIMQKSYHLAMIKPFYGNNTRNEIVKMPKVYFYDTGLRNVLLGNLQSWDERIDNGPLLENIFFKQLLLSTNDEIHFWRSKQKEEVDFVVGNNAYEVKTNKKKFLLTDYASFIKKYPEKKLSVIDFWEALIFGKV